MKAEPLVKEVEINAPPARMWRAITDINEMKHWGFEDFKPEVGFEFQFYGGPPEKKYLHLCKVTEVVPNKKLTYSWQYGGYTGISYVTFELFAEGNKTRLKLTHAGIDSFLPEDLNLAPKNFAEGWEYILNTSIKEYVEAGG